MRRDEYFQLPGNKVVDALLAIDLGNSRTAMIVLDSLNEESEKPIYSYPTLVWKQESLLTNEQLQRMPAPFGSLVSCIKPAPGSMSFIRCGKQAEYNLRAMSAQNGSRSLSSPKRYFYDQGKNRRKWIAVDHANASPSVVPLSETTNGLTAAVSPFAAPSSVKANDLATALAYRYGCVSPDELPRAALLGAMVVEIFEQALHHVNSESYRREKMDERPRWISCVHLTYPTTFTHEEKMRYIHEVDKALRVLVAGMNQRKMMPELGDTLPYVEVLSEIDEASAVLSFYSAARVKDVGNAIRWLASVGRELSQGDATSVSARFATIDIGGGTTDLAIADVRPRSSDPANSVEINLLFLDGVNCAGDDFLAEYIQKFFLKSFVIACYGASWIPSEDSYSLFAKAHNRFVAVNKNILSVLVDAIIQCISCLERGAKAQAHFGDEARGVLSEWLHNYKPDFEFAEEVVTLDLESNEYHKSLEAVFSPTLRKMGQEIASYGCDEVIVSGKITEFAAVRDLICDILPLPRHSIVCVSDTMRGQDIKFSTVFGGACAAMHKLQIRNAPRTVEFRLSPDLQDKYVWGKSTDPAIRDMALSKATGTELDSSDGTISVPYTGKDVYLLRQRAGHIGTVCVSHKISCRDTYLRVGPGTSMKISVAEGERKEIIAVSGCDVNGNPLRPDQFDLRVYGSVGNNHWLDIGTIEDQYGKA